MISETAVEMAEMSGSKQAVISPVPYIFRREHKEGEFQKKVLLRERLKLCSNLYRRDLRGHYGCVNAIEFSHNGGEWLASGGDDKRVLLWNVERALSDAGKPIQMKAEHNSNIFCLAFDNGNQKIFSGGNDEQVTVHDVARGEPVDVFMHEEAVYGLTVHPFNDSVFASACDDGRVLIFDIRERPSTDPFCLANSMAPMHAVMYNPVEPRLLCTANSKEGVALWDIRKPRSCVLHYGGSMSQQSCMSVRINQTGDKIIALRRRLPPVMYHIHSPKALFQFDHAGYYNSCTMKSCCFAGDHDQYLISGSDDFNLYMWRIPDDKTASSWISNAHLVLKGHRSIVNQVRFNPANHLIVSSGVEKVIKAWSPFQLPNSQGSYNIEDDDPERSVYTHEEYINLVLRSGQVMSHDYSNQSTDEDPRMMAFFDSLVQRELEEWSTDDSLSSNEEFYSRFMQVSNSDDTVNESGSHSEDGGFSPFTLAFASVVTNINGGQENESGNLLDLDEHTARVAASASRDHSEERGEMSGLEGQRPGNSRRSISGLIAQKRREYLVNLKRSHEHEYKTKLKRLKILKRRVESSSDSTSNSKSKKKKKKSETLSDTTSESDSNSDRESNSKTDRKLKFPSFKKQKPHLKRLNRLRALIGNSDSSDSDSGHKRVQFKSKEFISTSDSSSSERGQVSCSEAKSKGKTTKTEVKNSRSKVKTSKSEAKTSKTEVKTSKVGKKTSDVMPSTSGVNTNSKGNSSDDDGLYGPYLEAANSCNRPDHPSSACHGPERADDEVVLSGIDIKTSATNGLETKSTPSCSGACGTEPAPSGSRTDSMEGGANGRDASNHTGDITWTEFKRFRNRLERARRYYRRKSQPDESSDDD